MSLRRNRLDDTAVAELDALDAALRGDDVAPEHADLATLVADVRETAPQATPAFLAELDARVREGFPPRDEAPAAAPRPKRPRRRLLFGGGAIAVSAAIAVGVVGIVGNGDDPRTDSGFERFSTSEPAPPAALESAPAPDAAAGAVAPSPVPAADEDAAVSRQQRSVERSASLDLTVPADEVQSTADAVVRTTDRVDGIVQTSSISVGEGTPGEARFELRVPSAKLDDALAAYSKLGSVANRTQDAQDITGTVVSAEDRLSDARAERRALLRALGQADTRREVESLRARLRIVRQDIARAEAQLRQARTRADLATVAVTVRGDGGKTTGSADDDSGWSVGDAAGDAGRLLEVVAGALIVGAAAILPLLALALGGAALARVLVRRRRERGLDAA